MVHIPKQRDDEPNWRLARCKGAARDLFFPEEDEMASPRALAICARCPIRAECLEWSIKTHQEFGIWGGLTETQRRAVTGSHHRARCPDCGSFDVMEQAHSEVCLACGLSWMV